jgi:hypothetical protein
LIYACGSLVNIRLKCDRIIAHVPFTTDKEF